jgi:anti-sigma factor RsiW
MKCHEFVRAIDLYLDGELSVMQTLRMHGHVAFCESCRRVMASEATLHSALTVETQEEEPPVSFRERILARVAAEAAQSPQSHPRARRFAFLWGVLAGALAAGLLLTVPMLSGGKRSESLAPVAAELAAKHVLYSEGGGGPLELSTSDSSQVSGWLEPRLGFEVDLPHLPGPDDRLVGGRVSTLADAPAAYLLYEWGGRRVSLFITRRLHGAGLRGTRQVVDGVELKKSVFHDVALAWWEEENLLYAVATRGGETNLLRFALLCARNDRVSKPQ